MRIPLTWHLAFNYYLPLVLPRHVKFSLPIRKETTKSKQTLSNQRNREMQPTYFTVALKLYASPRAVALEEPLRLKNNQTGTR